MFSSLYALDLSRSFGPFQLFEAADCCARPWMLPCKCTVSLPSDAARFFRLRSFLSSDSEFVSLVGLSRSKLTEHGPQVDASQGPAQVNLVILLFGFTLFCLGFRTRGADAEFLRS